MAYAPRQSLPTYDHDHWYIWRAGERLAGPFKTSKAAKAAFLVICY